MGLITSDDLLGRVPSLARFLLVAALILAHGILAPPARAQATAIALEMTDSSLSPTEIRVTLGSEVQIRMYNNGTMGHNLTIVGYAEYDPLIPQGGQSSLFFVADRLGTFAMYCGVLGHRAAGMEGTFVVSRVSTDPPDPPSQPLPLAVIAAIVVITVSAIAAFVVVILLRRRRRPRP